MYDKRKNNSNKDFDGKMWKRRNLWQLYMMSTCRKFSNIYVVARVVVRLMLNIYIILVGLLNIRCGTETLW